MRITRHFEEIDGRQVHYRRCGQGPALILLHASPVSSKIFEPAMRIFAQQFTCFAFDTPGNGLSDPLVACNPDITSYAEAQIAVLRQLKIEKAVLYGRHTGASIAVEMGRAAPELVTMVMTDGFPVFTLEQRDAYLSGYLDDLPSSEDGSHIPWLWNRYRDQFAFWPWNKRNADFRADCDMPDLNFLHDGVVALLEAGNSYKAPYRAVFTFDAMEALAEVSVPVCIASRPGDSLYRKFGDFPDDLWSIEMPREFPEACAAELAIMVEHRPERDAPDVPTAGQRGIVPVGRHDVHYLRLGSEDTRPVVLIGPSPGSVMPFLEKMKTNRPVIGLDPLCAGDSGDGPVRPDQQAAILRAALVTLNLMEHDIAGVGSGANIALEMARHDTDAQITLIDPLLVDEPLRAACAANYGGDCRLQMDGTHMLKLWMFLRDQILWFPHFDRQRKNIVSDSGYDWAAVDRDFLAQLKHAPVLAEAWRAAWAYPLRQKLAEFDREPRMVFTSAGLVPPTVHGLTLSEYERAL